MGKGSPIRKFLKWVTAFLKAMVDTSINVLLLMALYFIAQKYSFNMLAESPEQLMLVLQWFVTPVSMLFYTLRNYKTIR